MRLRGSPGAAACFAVNAESVAALAQQASGLGALLIHYSTDYVFDGAQRTPYLETDPTAPINTYGRSKLAGEQEIIRSGCRHLILRTSWVYARRGHNFLLTMRRLAAEREELRIVADQFGVPNWSRPLAEATVAPGDFTQAGHRGACEAPRRSSSREWTASFADGPGG